MLASYYLSVPPAGATCRTGGHIYIRHLRLSVLQAWIRRPEQGPKPGSQERLHCETHAPDGFQETVATGVQARDVCTHGAGLEAQKAPSLVELISVGQKGAPGDQL